MYVNQPGPAHRLELELRARIAKARALGNRGDRGASAVEWVIISAVLIILVGIVAGVLYTKITSAANQLDVNPNTGGSGGGGKV